MNRTDRVEGAPRPRPVGRERKGKNSSSAILGHEGLGFKGRRDPDRFQAAALARILRRAGLDDAATDVDRAFGLNRRAATPACTCYCGMVRVVVACAACRGFRTGEWS